MPITHNAKFESNISAVLYGHSDIVDQLVKAAVIIMADGNREMMNDYQADYQDKQSIECCFSKLREQTVDFIDDVVNDLRLEMLDRLAAMQINARVRKIEYDDAGKVTDAEVNINFE